MVFEQPKFWRTIERHPIGSEYEDITGPIFDEMVATIKSVGVVDRKVVLHEGKVLDGWQLLRACIVAEVKPEFSLLPKHLTAEEFVKIKNDLRRQSPEDETIARIKARRERVAAARASGKSFRTIADDEDVAEATVRRDLDTPGAPPPGAPEKPKPTTPPKIQGRDGKTYDATKPAIQCERCKRTGKNDPNCEGCAASRQAAKPKPLKSGSPRFDEKKFDAAYGALVRVVDERANALGKGPRHKKCIDSLGDFLEVYKLWKKETA